MSVRLIRNDNSRWTNKNSHSLERSIITTHGLSFSLSLCQVQSPVSSLYAGDAAVKAPPTFTKVMTHTHTHTHVGFYGLRGLSIGVMVFILYKLYVLLPYTYPTPKLSPHRRRCISTFPPKNSLCMIYKRFKLWGH